MESVSTLAVEWIEIVEGKSLIDVCTVSTLAVEWIEIPLVYYCEIRYNRLHPRGGVD